MPVIAIIIPIAVDLAVTAVAVDTIATIAAGTLILDAAIGTIGFAGALAAGAIGGVAGSVVSAELTGGDVGKAALLGGLGGALSGGLASAGGGLTSGIVNSVHTATNLPTSVISTVLKAAEGAGIGAGRALATGGNIGQGALAGGISGLGSGLGGQINYVDIANQTGLPPDVVQGVLNAAGKAGFGAGAAAATGQDVGLSAVAGAAEGALPPLIKEALDGAKAAYNAAVAAFSDASASAQSAAQQAAQDAYAAIVTPAQNQLNALEQQGQDYLDSYKAGLISQIQDAQAKYNQALAAVNQEPWAIRIVNGEAPPPSGPRGSGNLNAYEAAKPTADAYQQAYQNVQAVLQQSTSEWDSIQQMVQSQFDSNSQPLIQTIQNAGSDPAVQQAYNSTYQQQITPAQQQLADAQTQVDTAQQQVDAAQQQADATQQQGTGGVDLSALNPIGTAQAGQTVAGTLDQFVNGGGALIGSTITYEAADGTTQTGTVTGLSSAVTIRTAGGTSTFDHAVLDNGQHVPLTLIQSVTGPVGVSPGLEGAVFDAANGRLSVPQAGGQDTGQGGQATDLGGTPGGQTFVPSTTSRDQQLINLTGLSQDTSPQQGVSTTNLDFGTFNAPVPSTHDQQIRTLAGLSTAPTTSQTAASSASGTGTTAGTGSATGTTEGFGGTGTGAGPPGTGTGAGGQEGGTGGGGEGGTGSGGGKTLDFGAGTIPLAQRRPAGQTGQTGPTTPDIPGPGSQALSQALAAPAIGYSPGGDIFGVLGKRTPVWNKSSLRAEDTSGVSG
jgi:hypothetical protein